MSITSYLELLPFNKIARYTESSAHHGIPFIGYPRQHPTEKHKLILVYDPLGENPKVMELKIDDILGVEEVHSAVTETGEAAPLLRLWVRKGAHGVMLEPFEVDNPIKMVTKPKDVPARLLADMDEQGSR
ncbi:MAG: hypothetical protein LBD74_06140 [Spirochaetaceae bacterium]|jgi:hypothetical protein|nr:hypothetical protein [Spirochaetaceae bacterium]